MQGVHPCIPSKFKHIDGKKYLNHFFLIKIHPNLVDNSHTHSPVLIELHQRKTLFQTEHLRTAHGH